MAKPKGGRDSYREYLDARGPGGWPCPCCGYRTLHEGPGDYDVCRICFWEDAADQLRWPTLADGPNAGSLLNAQRKFLKSDPSRAKPGEEREEGWRPLDPDLDDFESGPADPQNLPWPEDPEAFYWWRPTYFRRAENVRPGPAPRRPPSNRAEQMMARILEVVPEVASVDVEIRQRYEAPAVMAFCAGLVPFVVSAALGGDTELALRIVRELNTGLASGDEYSNRCVDVGFLSPQYCESDEDSRPRERIGFRSEELAEFVAMWPKEIRTRLHRRMAHQARMQRKDESTWIPQPDGSFKLTRYWKIRHPMRWWKMRRGGLRIAG